MKMQRQKSSLLMCSLLLGILLSSALSYAQIKMISGQVIDEETKEALPGVSIMIEGTAKGTVTDIDGNYKIEVDNQEAVLLFSFVGYKTPAYLPHKEAF